VGADITQIARGIGLDSRIGPRFLQAGIGWGGSCFGKDTAALVSTAREYNLDMPIVSAAREVNFSQREVVIEKLQAQLKILKGKTIALLGLAFKPNTDDLRDAPALDIARMLIERGAKVNVHDPVAMQVAKEWYPDLEMNFCTEVDQAIEGVDAIVLVTEWPEYRQLPWKEMRGRVKGAYLLDGRNYLPKDALEADGFFYEGIGY